MMSLNATYAQKPQVLFGGVYVDDSVEKKFQSDGFLIEGQILQRLRSSDKVQLIPQKEIKTILTEISSSKEKQRSGQQNEIQKARSMLSKGKSFYHQLKYDEAIVHLKESRRLFITSLNLLRSNRELIEAHLFLGMSLLAQNDKKEAQTEFERVVNLDPKLELSTTNYSPLVVEEFAKAKQKVMKQKSIRLKVFSNPEGAKVYINGRLHNELTPCTVQVQPGDYFILVEKERGTSWYKLLSLSRPLETVEAQLNQGPSQKSVFRTREGNEQYGSDARKLMYIAQQTGATYVLLSRLEKVGEYRLLTQWFEVPSQSYSKVAVASLGSSLTKGSSRANDSVDTMVGMLGTAQKNPYLVAGAQEPLDPKQGKKMKKRNQKKRVRKAGDKKPWYKRWWIYPAVAGFGAAVFLGAREIGGTSGSRAVFDNSGNI